MHLEGTRFGGIEFDESGAIDLPQGLIGFPGETRFILLEPGEGRKIAWLQSLTTPSLAFPVIDGSTIADDYPSPSPQALAREAALADADVSILVIVAARSSGTRLVANLLAPIVVDLTTRRAAQVVLDARRYSAARPLDIASEPRLARAPRTTRSDRAIKAAEETRR